MVFYVLLTIVLPLEYLQRFQLPVALESGVRMFAERKVEFGGTEEYCLGMGEFLEAPFAVIGSHAGVTGAVEGDTLYHQMQADFIYAASAVLLGGHDLLCPGFIGCEEIESQTMLAGCDEIQQFIFFGCFVRHHRKKRTEELVLNYILVGIHRVDDRGFETLPDTPGIRLQRFPQQPPDLR